MRKLAIIILSLVVCGSAIAAKKDTGTTTLKDFQPAGTPDKKQHKKQQFDLSFVAISGTDYTCRSGEKDKLKATDFVVGSSITYEVSGNKGKVKTASGKQVDCKIVRIAGAPAAAN